MNSLTTYFISLKTIVYYEVKRFLRIWIQTLLPSAISSILYFIIFGNLIGKRIGSFNGTSYMEFIAPGLIMMAIITNSYSNVVSTLYGARFQRSIEEILVSPTPNAIILLGYTLGGVLRGLLVGILVTIIALFFTKLSIHHLGLMILITLLTASLFSLAGFTNAMFAKSFDDVSIVPTFILTPLTYLGGVFYSIHQLPTFWQYVSKLNPILYIVNTFRYSFLAISDVSIASALLIVIFAVILLVCINLYLLNKGIGIRS
jgi:ABC-2 type transport system permease protein